MRWGWGGSLCIAVAALQCQPHLELLAQAEENSECVAFLPCSSTAPPSHPLSVSYLQGLFSATQTRQLRDLVRAGLRNPVFVRVQETQVCVVCVVCVRCV